MAGSQGPSQLATEVARAIKQRNRAPIDRYSLARLFADLYAASFQTEEGHPIEAMVVLGRPSSLQTSSDRDKSIDRWRPWLFREPIPFTVESLTKLARAADARSSAICVDVSAGATTIWGLVDQQDKPYGSLVWDLDIDRPSRPGRIQVVIEGTAHLSVWIGYAKVAELRGSTLLPREIDVLSGGPVRDALLPGPNLELEDFRRDEAISKSEFESVSPALTRFWFGALTRILFRTVAYHVGGGLLLTPDESMADLSGGHKIPYDRVKSGLRSRWRAHVDLMANRSPSPERSRALRLREQARSELDGATRFVSLLTRVDGIVVLNMSLEVLAFGSRIVTKENPPAAQGHAIPLARNRGATAAKLGTIAYDHYGTRHQAVFRYCQATPGAVGLVVSHDQVVRAATLVNGSVTLWDRVLLLRELRPRPGRRPAASP